MQSKTASEILGNPEYQAISFGGYRKESREFQQIELSDAETLFKMYEMNTQNLLSQI